MDRESSACSTTLVVTEAEGLHVRPAAEIARVAGQFDADISVEHDGKSANGKSLLGICTLCAQMGAHLTVSAVGRDARRAIKAIEVAFSRLFGAVASAELDVSATAPRLRMVRRNEPEQPDAPAITTGAMGTSGTTARALPGSETRRLRRVKGGRKPQAFVWSAARGNNVFLAGDFSDWKPVPMERSGNGFTAVVELSPGEHQYKFIVDGEWQSDPSAPEAVPNGFGTANSVVRVK